MAVKAPVDILMATYQGESWLDVQMSTIFAQDCDDWRLLIRDDGSTDHTRDIIRSWRDRHPGKITFIDEQNAQNLGVSGNFSALMSASSAPYIMFSSWDDVWYRDKVSNAVKAMKAFETKHGPERPLLVHTDVRVVDSNLHELYASGRKELGLMPPANPTVSRFCLENTAWGCTVIINRALLKLAFPIPISARCEDWWLALVAAAFGFIDARPEISIDWRRHGANNSAERASWLTLLGRALTNPIKHRRAFYTILESNRETLLLFLERFDSSLSSKDRSAVQAFLSLPTLGFLDRRRVILKHRIFFSSWARTIGLLLLG